jgi:hypothetical protein
MIRSDPTLPSTPWSSEWYLSLGLSHQNLVHFSLFFHACHTPCSPPSPWLDLLKISGDEYTLWSSLINMWSYLQRLIFKFLINWLEVSADCPYLQPWGLRVDKRVWMPLKVSEKLSTPVVRCTDVISDHIGNLGKMLVQILQKRHNIHLSRFNRLKPNGPSYLNNL